MIYTAKLLLASKLQGFAQRVGQRTDYGRANLCESVRICKKVRAQAWTRTWNLRLRRPTPYPLGQRAVSLVPGEQRPTTSGSIASCSCCDSLVVRISTCHAEDPSSIPCSLVVSTSACHTEDPGSIPCGAYYHAQAQLAPCAGAAGVVRRRCWRACAGAAGARAQTQLARDLAGHTLPGISCRAYLAGAYLAGAYLAGHTLRGIPCGAYLAGHTTLPGHTLPGHTLPGHTLRGILPCRAYLAGAYPAETGALQERRTLRSPLSRRPVAHGVSVCSVAGLPRARKKQRQGLEAPWHTPTARRLLARERLETTRKQHARREPVQTDGTAPPCGRPSPPAAVAAFPDPRASCQSGIRTPGLVYAETCPATRSTRSIRKVGLRAECKGNSATDGKRFKRQTRQGLEAPWHTPAARRLLARERHEAARKQHGEELGITSPALHNRCGLRSSNVRFPAVICIKSVSRDRAGTVPWAVHKTTWRGAGVQGAGRVQGRRGDRTGDLQRARLTS